MSSEESLDLIKAALKRVEPKKVEKFKELSLQTRIEDLGLDSLAMMEMIGFLEDQLEATFSDEEMARVESIEDLVSLVRTGKVP